MARYYYADGQDYPFAADLRQATGTLTRFYLLTDTLGSVVLVTDSAGAPVERVHYDPWGQPTVESVEQVAPAISRVIAQDGAILVVFSEQVSLPVTFGPGPAIENPSINESLSAVLTFSVDGDPINGSGAFALSSSDYLFGTVVRFEPTSPLPNGTEITVTLQAGSLVDGWGNPVGTDSIGITWSG